jgi:hypothetical protein
VIWRELTESNLFSGRLSGQGKSADCSACNPTSAEQALIRNRRRRFLICEIRALNHADILRLEKRLTVLFYVLKRETRLDHFQLAGPLSGKSENKVLLATQSGSWEGELGYDLALFKRFNPLVLSLIVRRLSRR